MDTKTQGEMAGVPSFEPAFYNMNALSEVELLDGITARFVVGGRMMFSYVKLAPGAVMPAHSHPHEQLGYVVEGSMVLTLDKEERDLHPGDAYTIPGGVTHRAVGGPHGCIVLDVFSPLREDYLEHARKSAKAE
jgi:quercetin dioxygenase-like cupin family protein